jgi:hypothetical protein
MNQALNRSREIEQKNKDLGHFLDIFAKLSEGSKAKVLQEISRLKKEHGGVNEAFLEEVKTLAVMYGAFRKETEGKKSEESMKVLGVQIGQIEAAATELRKVNVVKSVETRQN